MNRDLPPDVQGEFRKDRGTRDQIANICWIIEKAIELQKNIYFCFIDYIKAAYCYPAYLTSMHSISCEMLGCMKHKLESRLLGEISITSDMQMTPPSRQKVKRN